MHIFTCNVALHMPLEILSGGVGVLFVIENDEIITFDFKKLILPNGYTYV